MTRILILALILIFFVCKKKTSVGNNQSTQSTANTVAASESLETQPSSPPEYEEPLEPDTITVFVKSTRPRGFECWFGKWTYYTANRNFLLSNGSYALVDWPSLEDEHVTAIYRLPTTAFPDTVVITTADTAIIRFSDGDQHPEGIDGNFVLMDFGCCPGPRGLMIIDLVHPDTILNTSYTNTAGYDSTQTLYYFAPFHRATKNDCPDYDRQIQEGLTPYVEQLYSFNLPTRQKVKTGKFRCSAYD